MVMRWQGVELGIAQKRFVTLLMGKADAPRVQKAEGDGVIERFLSPHSGLLLWGRFQPSSLL
jgi:hypothetical protein